MQSRQPNILILMADQLTPGALPCYGNKVAKTPFLNALAADSVVFESAYTNSPLCAPSRYVFMSGKLPSVIGAYDNAAELPTEVLTFGHYLRHGGYRTILSGKMHFCGPDQLHGFEERLTTDIYPADFGWTPDWDHPDERPSWYHNMSSVTDAGLCIRTNQLDFDDEVVFAAEHKLYDIARGDDKRPFCLLVSMTHPHDPYAISADYWNRYQHDEIDMPKLTLAEHEHDPHSQRLRQVCELDKVQPTAAQIRNARHAYYGAVSYVDDQIGRLRHALEQSGLADDTVVIMLGDHGDMLGERGLWYKMNFFEGSTRIPLMVHYPAWFKPGRVSASVSLADILPTLVDIAHRGNSPAAPESLDGRSLWGHLNGDTGHDEVIGEYLGEGAIAPIVMIRRGRFKFVHSPADPDQLYDLADDPLEQYNLATRPEYTEQVAAFRQEIAQRWDLGRLEQAVRHSQRRRHFHYQAENQGKRRNWDFQPFDDASLRYMRNHIDLDSLEAMARFPRIHPQ